MLSSILLEKEQKDLLEVLVEASRNVSLDKRQKFFAVETLGSHLARILHPGLPKEFPGGYMGDIEILGANGLIRISYGSKGTPRFDVTPIGFAYYKEIKKAQGESTEIVETTIRSYLVATDFRQQYRDAYEKWSEAEDLLWQSESESQLTTIGHLCREAMQLFANILVSSSNITDIDPDVAHIVSRLKSVISSSKVAKSTSKKSFLEALIAYWGAISDLVQRQEHGALKEGEALFWEDARRIVFQTANVMFEFDRAIRVSN